MLPLWWCLFMMANENLGNITVLGKQIDSGLVMQMYMCQWNGSSLVLAMAHCPFSAKPLPEPIRIYCRLDPRKQTQWNLKQDTKSFIHKNDFQKVVCKEASILFMSQCCNSWYPRCKWCHMVTEIWVNIGSGSGLLPDGTKPYPELISKVWWHSPEGNFTGNTQEICHQYEFENY